MYLCILIVLVPDCLKQTLIHGFGQLYLTKEDKGHKIQ